MNTPEPEVFMWTKNLSSADRKIMYMIAGNLNLPDLSEYENMTHFLRDVYSRINEAGSLARQTAKALGKI